MTPPLAKPRLILGSASPRRRELLNTLGLVYEVSRPDVPEVLRVGESPVGYVTRLAQEKAIWVMANDKAVASPLRAEINTTGTIVISADTIVVLNDQILEKPSDAQDAVRMLKALSGVTHTVHTGVCLLGDLPTGRKIVSFTVATAVTLKKLSDHEIAAYIRTGEPLDKAGGYGAQGIGSYMVKKIEGSYASVVGLPVAELIEHLERNFHYPLWNE